MAKISLSTGTANVQGWRPEAGRRAREDQRVSWFYNYHHTSNGLDSRLTY